MNQFVPIMLGIVLGLIVAILILPIVVKGVIAYLDWWDLI